MSRIVRAVGIFRWLLVLGAFAAAVGSFATYGTGHEHASSNQPMRFHCPMHPEIRSPDPGECPICYMRLEPIPEERAMPRHAHESGDAGVDDEPPPAGLVPVEVTVDRQQQFGIATEPVVRAELVDGRRYPAVLEARPGASAEVRVRTPAFVERIAIDRTGVRVRRGQALAYVFSPEIARLDDELASARSLLPEEGGGSVAQRVETGLSRAGVDTSSQRVRSETAHGRYALRSPSAGIVTSHSATVGAYVTPEAPLFTVTDLGRLFAVASLPDVDRASLAPGTEAMLELPGLAPTRVRLDVAEPELDPATRTARVRFEIENEDGALLPGTLGTLVLSRAAATSLVVPREAVVDTGTQRYVFVDRGLGYFAPRTVQVGPTHGDRTVVLAGLAEGERVVVRGGFLLDSESRLRGALAGRRSETDAGAAAAHIEPTP